MAWEIVETKHYPALATYVGPYEGVIAQFSTGPEQLPFMNDLGLWLAERVASEAVKKGVTPLRLIVYRDITPTWQTDWSVEFLGHGSPAIGITTLIAIIVGCLMLIGVIFFGMKAVEHWTAYREAEIEREEEREEFVKYLVEEHDVAPTDALAIAEGIKAPPAGIEVPDVFKGIAEAAAEAALPAIGIGVGILLLVGLVMLAKPQGEEGP